LGSDIGKPSPLPWNGKRKMGERRKPAEEKNLPNEPNRGERTGGPNRNSERNKKGELSSHGRKADLTLESDAGRTDVWKK